MEYIIYVLGCITIGLVSYICGTNAWGYWAFIACAIIMCSTAYMSAKKECEEIIEAKDRQKSELIRENAELQAELQKLKRNIDE